MGSFYSIFRDSNLTVCFSDGVDSANGIDFRQYPVINVFVTGNHIYNEKIVDAIIGYARLDYDYFTGKIASLEELERRKKEHSNKVMKYLAGDDSVSFGKERFESVREEMSFKEGHLSKKERLKFKIHILGHRRFFDPEEPGIWTGEDGISFYYFDSWEVWKKVQECKKIFDEESEKAGEDVQARRDAHVRYRQNLRRVVRQVQVSLIKDLLQRPDIHEETRMMGEVVIDLYENLKDNPTAEAFLDEILRGENLKIDLFFGYSDLDDEEWEDDEIENEGFLFELRKPIIQKLGFGDPQRTKEELYWSLYKKIFRSTSKSTKLQSSVDLKKVKEFISGVISRNICYRRAYDVLMMFQLDKKFREKIREDMAKILFLKSVKTIHFSKKLGDSYSVNRKILGKMHKVMFLIERTGRCSSKKEKIKSFLESYKEREPKESYFHVSDLVAGFWESGEKEGHVEISRFFPRWYWIKKADEELRKKKKNVYEGKVSLAIMDLLLQQVGFALACDALQRKEGVGYLPFFILDVEDPHKNGYVFWKAVKELLDSGLSLPSQTFTVKRGRIDNSKMKNAYMSALRRDKTLEMRSKFFKTGGEGEYYVLVEHSSVVLGNPNVASANSAAYKHYRYEVFCMSFDGKGGVKVRQSDESFTILAGELTQKEKLSKFLQSHDRIVVISGDLNSPVLKMLKEEGITGPDKYFAVYYEAKTPVLRTEKGWTEDKNAYVLSGEELMKGFRHVTPQIETCKSAIRMLVRGPFMVPSHLREMPYISSSLSIFSVVKLVGEWDATNISRLYQIFLCWHAFENESGMYLHSKPKLLSKKLPYLMVRRKGRTFKISLNAVIFELAFLYESLRQSMGLMVEDQ